MEPPTYRAAPQPLQVVTKGHIHLHGRKKGEGEELVPAVFLSNETRRTIIRNLFKNYLFAAVLALSMEKTTTLDFAQ